jgi:hypothetical protein
VSKGGFKYIKFAMRINEIVGPIVKMDSSNNSVKSKWLGQSVAGLKPSTAVIGHLVELVAVITRS